MRAMARWFSAPIRMRRTRVCSGGSLKTRLVVWCVVQRRRRTELGRELALLVAAGVRAAVDGQHVVVACQQHGVGRQRVHRVVPAQRGVERVGVVDEARRRRGQAERLCAGRLSGHRPAPPPRHRHRRARTARASTRIAASTPARQPSSMASFMSPRWPMRKTRPCSGPRPPAIATWKRSRATVRSASGSMPGCDLDGRDRDRARCRHAREEPQAAGCRPGLDRRVHHAAPAGAWRACTCSRPSVAISPSAACSPARCASGGVPQNLRYCSGLCRRTQSQ